MVKKSLKDGSTAIFAGIPVTTAAQWSKFFSAAGCKSYAAPGFVVRANDKLLMFFSFADGKLPPESLIQKGQIDCSGNVRINVGKKVPYLKDVFTGEKFPSRNGVVTFTHKHPRTLLFELR